MKLKYVMRMRDEIEINIRINDFKQFQCGKRLLVKRIRKYR